jgi:hypothetical protein
MENILRGTPCAMRPRGMENILRGTLRNEATHV